MVPYVFISFSYVRIFGQVRRGKLAVKKDFECTRVHKNERGRISSDAKVAKVFCIVSATFVLCWSPVIYMTTASMVLNRPDIIPDSLATVSLFMIVANSLANPLIYAILKADFNMAIRNFIGRCLPGQNRVAQSPVYPVREG